MVDDQLERVLRPFRAAEARMRSTCDSNTMEDELSNMLQHIYRLAELRRSRWADVSGPGKISLKETNQRLSGVPGALGALWIRQFDTHELIVLTFNSTGYGPVWGPVYDPISIMWKPRPKTPTVKGHLQPRIDDYDHHLAGKEVLDTLPIIFDRIADLS